VITITESKSEEEKMLDEFLKAEDISDIKIKEILMKEVIDILNRINHSLVNKKHLESFTKNGNIIYMNFKSCNDSKSYFIEI